MTLDQLALTDIYRMDITLKKKSFQAHMEHSLE